MIDETIEAFPNNVVDLLATRLETLYTGISVFRRPLRRTDPVESVGVSAAYWSPGDFEIRGSRHGPTLSEYHVAVECFIKDMDQVRGLRKHSLLSVMVRNLIYRDATLTTGLRALSISVDGVTERLQRHGLRTQRFSANEIQGAFLYLSVMDFWFETETT